MAVLSCRARGASGQPVFRMDMANERGAGRFFYQRVYFRNGGIRAFPLSEIRALSEAGGNINMLACKIKGSGKPVVLLHAFPLSGKMWEDELDYLSSRYRVIAPDLPGFGESSACPDRTMAGMALKVKETLDHLEIRQPVFMAGLSMGGYAALEFFRQFPAKLSGLGLFATRATADTQEAREKRFLAMESIEKFGMEPFARKAVKSQLGASSQEENPELHLRVLDWMKACPADSAIGALRGMAARTDLSYLLPKFDFPVLIIAGEEDLLAPPPEMRLMQGPIPDAQFHIVPKAGHLVNLENPSAFRSLFEAFLNEI